MRGEYLFHGLYVALVLSWLGWGRREYVWWAIGCDVRGRAGRSDFLANN